MQSLLNSENIEDNPTERVQGTIAVFTLNNSYPDTLIQTESTVLSLDCLPSKPYDLLKYSYLNHFLFLWF